MPACQRSSQLELLAVDLTSWKEGVGEVIGHSCSPSTQQVKAEKSEVQGRF